MPDALYRPADLPGENLGSAGRPTADVVAPSRPLERRPPQSLHAMGHGTGSGPGAGSGVHAAPGQVMQYGSGVPYNDLILVVEHMY